MERNTLTVSGSGEAKAAPDVAYVTVGVVTQGKQAKEAAQANAATTQKVMEALKKLGIVEKDLQTSNFSVQPLYENRPDREPVIVGYQVSNQVRSTVHKLGDVGNVIDASMEAGANNVQGVSFGLEARSEPESKALAEAVQEARRKAETLAKAAGVRITGVAQIHEGGYSPRPLMETGATFAAARVATPISPGELNVNANVTVVFNIAPGAAQAKAEMETTREAGLRTQRLELRKQLRQLKTKYTDTHPAVVELRQRIAEIDREIKEASKEPRNR